MQQDRYERKQKLGEGAMGTTWLVYDRRLGVEWAMKSWKESGSPTDRQQETQVLKVLQSRYFPRIVECFREKDRQFLVMDRIMGITLEEKLQKEGPMEAQETIALLIELCEALRTLHENVPPILHLDVKPSNIMLTEEGVKLIDFGSALIGWDPKQAGSGTYGYSAPEQMRGKPVDVRSDIYSLGAIGLTMRTGKRPESKNRKGGQKRFCFRNRKQTEENTPEMQLDKVIRCAMQERPERRFQTAAEMKNALFCRNSAPLLIPYQIEKEILRTEKNSRIE